MGSRAALAAALSILGVALGSCTNQGSGRVPLGTITIGLELSLTGEDAPDGIPAENGANLVKTYAPVSPIHYA